MENVCLEKNSTNTGRGFAARNQRNYYRLRKIVTVRDTRFRFVIGEFCVKSTIYAVLLGVLARTVISELQHGW